ncbi:proline-rich receptor-like protein kinase PERK8 isoform X2 [Brachypodium distachyon]|uniref:proline-rich receptor-like protein kinase PERK8 isoform X2 n=2 Tax=Brachypodium distachyon TaxID=15368 RepID=UPI000D0D3C92|nr:proline-rich receptor-like protein kinase PERK8 isoform X2 [Brachypodium distachyon]|eukprot:XP_024319398.1 proline-rich receptor-like protein kinase PERK8 isoform X2 [Brachypodium distachyon]
MILADISDYCFSEVLLCKLVLIPKMEPKELSIELLKKITNGFSEKIGEGSFGVVYKGKLNGQQVAVKKLRDSSVVNEREFEREVQILRLVEQQNIVKLIGYCYQKQDKIEPSGSFGARDVVDKFLCFEYVSNGSIDNHIYAWWQGAVRSSPPSARKGTMSVVLLTAWSIWKHRNAAVFDNSLPNIASLLDLIKAEARQWSSVRAVGLGTLLPLNLS